MLQLLTKDGTNTHTHTYVKVLPGLENTHSSLVFIYSKYPKGEKMKINDIVHMACQEHSERIVPGHFRK